MLISLILGFVLGAGALVFAFENTEAVALTFLSWQFESSLAVVTLLAVLVGILIASLLSLPSAVSSAFSMHALERENRRLRRELENTRTTVVTEEVVYPVRVTA